MHPRTFIGVASLALTLASCGPQPLNAPSRSSVVKLGIAAPFTGAYAKIGDDMWKAATLAADECNERGGVLGRTIELVRGDDEGAPQRAESVAHALADEEVAGVIGHFSSSCTIPSSAVLAEHKIPLISPSATNPQVTDRGLKYVFRVCGRDDRQGKVGATFALNSLKAKRVAVLHDRTPYGERIAEEFRRTAEKLGLEIIDFGGAANGAVQSIRAANPELLYFAGAYGEAGLLLLQARAAGLKSTFMSDDSCVDPEFIKAAGAQADGSFLTFAPDPEKAPSAKAFLEKYRARFGEPGPYCVYTYVAANVLLSAIQKTGATDGAQIADALRRDAFDTAMGQIQFDENGDITNDFYVMWTVRDGKFAPCE